MSFGFGVGDFLTVIELATKIRKRFSDAPTKLQDISHEVKSLSILLSDVAVHANKVVEPLHPSKAEDIKTILKGSKHVLRDLDELLTKYEGLNPDPISGETHRLKRVWERLLFDPGDVSDLRARLTSNITMLEAFVANITQRKTQKSLARINKYIDGKEQQQILDWVSTDSQRHTDRLNWLVQHRESGTRKWLFESSQWETWTSDEGKGQTLFCPGIPGAGKTHASAMVLERLYSIFPSDSVGIAFAFCDYQRSEDGEEIDLPRNLLRMILERPHAWPAELRPLYESSRRSRSEISVDEVFSLLRISMRARIRNFVVIDAIDELESNARDVLIPRLFELQRRAGLNMFVTSRDIGPISDLFSGAMQKRIRATDEDIEQYISTHMGTFPSFVSENIGLQNQIRDSVVQAAGEMFLLANLHLDSLALKAKKSPKSLRKALEALQNSSSGPESIKEALETAMQRVISQPEETASTAAQTLMILTTARRALTVNELCHALAIDLEDLEGGFDKDNVPQIAYVLSSCAGLVVIETKAQPTQGSGLGHIPATASQSTKGPNGDSLVKLAHKSIRDYLSSTQSKWFGNAESHMAAICRTFQQALENDSVQQQTPFVAYAKDHWGIHHLEADRVTATKATEKEIAVKLPRQVSFPLAVKHAGDQFGLRQLALELHGLRDIVVLWACQQNSINILEIFLSLNIDSFLEPLSKFGHPTEADQNCGYTWCPAHAGSLDIYPDCKVPALAVCSATTNEPRVIDEALVTAIEYDRQLIAEILVSHGASIAGRNRDGFTALGMAACEGHSNVLGWLLGLDTMEVEIVLAVQFRLVFAGGSEEPCKPWSLKLPYQDPKFEESDNSRTRRFIPSWERLFAITPLAGAALNGHEECVSIILEWMRKHCPESSTSGWKTTCTNAVLCAMQRGHLKVMRRLLPLIDINAAAPGMNGFTPLHFAILMQNTEAVRVLSQEPSFDPSVADKDGRTALTLAVSRGSQDLIHELGACDAVRGDPMAALEALFERHDSTFMLLCKEASTCIPGGLFAADGSGYSFFDRILFNCVRRKTNARAVCPDQMDYGTKIEDIDAYGWTPIEEGVDDRFDKAFYGKLKRLGTELFHPDNYPIFGRPGGPKRDHCFGVTTLYLALATHSHPLLRSLLKLCPTAVRDVDSRGRTILMAAVVRGSQKSLEVILEALKEQKDTTIVNTVSEAGESALSLAFGSVRHGQKKRLMSLLSFDGLDLRLMIQEDKDGNCPLMTLATKAANLNILPFHTMPKATERLGDPGPFAPGRLLYRNCLKLFNALSAKLGPEELSTSLLSIAESQLTRTGMRITDTLSQMPEPGCLAALLQSCPALRPQLHTPDANGMTSLMLASRTWRSHETITFLLNTSEVEVGYRDAEGRTALSHVAQNLGQFSDGGVAKVLIEEYEQDPLAVDNHGWSPLHYAVCNGNVWEGSPYHQLLKDADVPMDWTDEHGSTPLHLAIKGGSPLAIKLLLQHSASSSWLNTVDADGLVPLAHFFLLSQTSTYMYYYSMRYPWSGPRREVVDFSNSFKYHWEAEEAIQKLLERPDVHPDIPDKEGKTPLWHALDSMRKEHEASYADLSSDRDDNFHDFLRLSVAALCERDDVDPLQPTIFGKTPLDLATEVAQIVNRRWFVDRDGGTDLSLSGDSDGKAMMRAMINKLGPLP